MKKLLLSSIIMLGVCGIAAAQTDAKAKPAEKNTISTAAATPQKSTIAASDAAPVGVAQINSDGTVAPVAAKSAPATKAEAVAASVAPTDNAQKIEEKKAKANAGNTQKTGKKQN